MNEEQFPKKIEEMSKRELLQILKSVREYGMKKPTGDTTNIEKESYTVPINDLYNDSGRSNGNAKKLTGSGYVPPRSNIDNRGFVTNIILGLMLAFASGAAVATIYIFMNLKSLIFAL